LAKVGWVLTPFTRDVDATFQGEGVIFYAKDDAQIAHTVLVRSGGIIVDPSPGSPEDGEFIEKYFNGVGGQITIKSVSMVTRAS
jgi:hypothetical protein